MVKRLIKIVLVLSMICGAQGAPHGGWLSGAWWLSGVEAHAAAVQLPATGQTQCYKFDGTEIVCAGTGQDGEKLMGVVWPKPRFTDNGNGTVTDNLTGLIWLKNANCTDIVGGIVKADGKLAWASALTWSNSLASGKCGISDGSAAGDWRLPSRRDLYSLVDLQNDNPALPAGHPFSNVQANYYWSSSSFANDTNGAWVVYMGDGIVVSRNKGTSFYVWPVRGGQ